jgi:signal transduction histidine kinase
MSMRRVVAAERGATEICAVVTIAARKTDISRAWQEAVRDRQRLSCQILAVQEAERKRVATDLHDGLGQALSAIKFTLEQAQAGLGAQQIEEASKILGGLVTKVKDAVDDVRHIAMNLRPSTLDDLGILATLSWFLREFQSTYGSVVVDKAFGVTEHEVPESVKLTLFRVVQEAMNNVAKHSHATRVAICLSRSGDDLTMTISDNGIGFDPIDLVSRDVRGTGLGRAGLRDRVEISGGTFQIDAARGKGVCLRMSWPLANESHFGNAECLNRCGGQDE